MHLIGRTKRIALLAIAVVLIFGGWVGLSKKLGEQSDLLAEVAATLEDPRASPSTDLSTLILPLARNGTETQLWLSFLGFGLLLCGIGSAALLLRSHSGPQQGGNPALSLDSDSEFLKASHAPSTETHYKQLFEDLPVPILEEGWANVKVLIDELVRNGVDDLQGYLLDNPSKLGELYNAADRYGASRAALRLYKAKTREEFMATMEDGVAGEDELGGYRDTIVAFYHGATSHQYEAEEFTLDLQPIRTRIKLSIPHQYRNDWARVLVTIEDITAAKAAEEELRQAQRMEVIGRLTGGIAHDFNNLLAVIGGNAELLSMQKGADTSLTQPILQAVGRGSDLTQHLVAFSRRQDLRPKSLDVGELVVNIESMLARTIGENIKIFPKVSVDLWLARADEAQLENALLNLVINARDSMPNGGEITIECSNAKIEADVELETGQEVHGEFVCLEVADKGSGMSEAVRKKAFEPFFTTKEVGKGSGLGLAMIFGFVKQSGGHLALRSEEGVGTSVRLYLPKSTGKIERSRAVARPALHDGKNIHILVIEDDPDVRAMTVNMLQDMNYLTSEAEDAVKARAILDADPSIRLILADLVLAGREDGATFVREALKSKPELSFVLMSGYAGELAEKPDSVLLGARLLRKPFHRKELAEALDQSLA